MEFNFRGSSLYRFDVMGIPVKPGQVGKTPMAIICLKDPANRLPEPVYVSAPCANRSEIDQEIDRLVTRLEELRFEAKHELAKLESEERNAS